MRVKIFSCLLAFILGCNFTAAIINRITTEDGHVFLNCPDSVTGKVTWSRESRGNRIDVMTTDGHEDIKHIHDPNKRFRSFGKKILGILRATISDAGLYFCNSEPAMELTVIPSGSNKIQTTAAAATEPSTAVTETASLYLWQMWVRTVIVILYLITMISITVNFWRKARRIAATHSRNRK
ncbi:uncharacterized protein LOC121958105 isoform X2 [Plectropomus leopardus]|uniref:uncharacterized protein LOC121958105 isoform X2 n=1 Tax=Plectropomus leopardus TaxID=160734 RepID=UPI001C4D3A10|nr:uncharacterized protein LOC121958105 isoform X2 [Plectropomus leopardus]